MGRADLGAQYLYVADIGDNGAVVANVSVFRVPEPVVSDVQSPVTTICLELAKFTFAYPDGPRDAESMFVDPQTKDIYIISKRESPHIASIEPRIRRRRVARRRCEYVTQFTDAIGSPPADISVGGNEIIVRGTGSVAGRLFIRPPGGSIADAFNTTPIRFRYVRRHKERRLALIRMAGAIYTTSEGSNRPIYYFDRLPHGDFNHNGTVEAADYAVWRKGLGEHVSGGAITQTWRANYGKSAPGDRSGSHRGSGAGAGALRVRRVGCCDHSSVDAAIISGVDGVCLTVAPLGLESFTRSPVRLPPYGCLWRG